MMFLIKRLVEKKKKQEKAFRDSVKKGRISSYNEAVDIQNKKIKAINDKYQGKQLVDENGKYNKVGKKYVREIDESWRKTYSETLLKNHGESIIYGKTWVESAPFMNMYSAYLDD